MNREKLIAPIEWSADRMCALLNHAGACFIASAFYNSRLARWAYRWQEPRRRA